jgi:MOSC domain-containing protein YiiM
MARVMHLFLSPKKHTGMEELYEVCAIANHGFEGCAHARPGGKRQVLLMDMETLREMNLTPGIIRENITTEGIAVNALKAGQRLRVGDVKLEVSAVCEPCELMEEIRPGLMAALVGRRGMMCRVVKGGMLRQGDEVVVCSLESIVSGQPSTVNS